MEAQVFLTIKILNNNMIITNLKKSYKILRLVFLYYNKNGYITLLKHTQYSNLLSFNKKDVNAKLY